jgi:hypothetical protein
METSTQFLLPVVQAGMTKSQIQLAASASVNEVIEAGNILEAGELISVMEEFIKQVKDHNLWKTSVRDEISKWGKCFNSNSGTKIELAETGTKYDYSKCDDPELLFLLQSSESIAEKLKARQEFLKTVPISGIDIVGEGGEVCRVFPPSKTSISSYKVTLCK